jgi:hypothetical protein
MKKMKIVLDIEFSDEVNAESEYDILERVADSLRHEVDNGEGLSPSEDAFTKQVTITTERDAMLIYDCMSGDISTV